LKRMVDTYLRVHICRQFGHAFTREYDLTPLPVPVAMPTGNDVTKCVEMIRNSKRPLLLIGSQALLSPIKVDQLKETVQALSIPVYLGGMARGLLGNKSDIQMRFSRRDALKEADLVILAGIAIVILIYRWCRGVFVGFTVCSAGTRRDAK
uniref:Acetolactate synthase-like protein (inferred by orthology to a C. elegans protein) n=1 Tax=Anisakis simplex TaxID=6269 RepID=A0A0M3KKF4_ANISI